MTSLRFSLEADPAAFKAGLNESRAQLAGRIRDGLEEAGRAALLDPLRKQTDAAFNSKKMRNTWRIAIYPKDDSILTLTPAAVVWNKIPDVMLAFEEGKTIRPVNGNRYLWIPTENTPLLGRNKPASPAETLKIIARVQRPKKGQLDVIKNGFIFRPTRNGNMVALARVGLVRTPADNRKNHHKKLGGYKYRQQYASPVNVEPGKVQVLAMYILVRQATLKKRLDIRSVVEQARRTFPSFIAKAAEESR